MGRPRTYAGITSSYVIGILCLLLVRSPVQVTLVYFFVLVSGIAIGGHSPVFAALLIDRLSGPRFGFLLGLQNIAYGAGASLGPFLAGILFDRFGSYTLTFLLLAVAAATSSVIVTIASNRLLTPRR